jgi:hypothetical protein
MNVEIGAEDAQFPENEIYKRNCRCSVLCCVSADDQRRDAGRGGGEVRLRQ